MKYQDMKIPQGMPKNTIAFASIFDHHILENIIMQNRKHHLAKKENITLQKPKLCL